MRLTAEQSKLVEDNLAFVHHVARKYGTVTHKEDLVQEGVLGMIRAAQLFREDKEVKFVTYASYWVRAYMSAFLKKQRTDANIENVPMGAEETITSELIQADLMDKMAQHMATMKLSERDQDIIISRYMSPTLVTLQELGEKYQISRQRVEQIEKNILINLKKHFTKRTY